MSPYEREVRGFLDGAFQRALILATTGLLLLWFSGALSYVNAVYLPTLTAVLRVAFTLGVVLLCAFAHNSWSKGLNSPFVVWWFIVVLLNLAWYAGFGGGDSVVINSRVTNLVLMAGAYFAFATLPEVMDKVRSGMVFLVVLATVLNIYDFLNPGAFIPPENEVVHFTRAAGMYMNPNIAGPAIVFGLILAIDKVPARWQTVFVLVCTIGVLITLSRASILGLAFAIGALHLNGSLARRVVWELSAIFCAVVLVIGVYFWDLISDLLGSNGLERVLWFTNPSGSADFSQEERIYLAAHGWEQFVAHPFVGNGVGSTEYWTIDGSTHNQYIQYMSDFGILGGVVVAALAFGIGVGARRWSIPFVVAAFVLFWSLFSNNVLTETSGLIALAMAAAWPRPPSEAELTERTGERQAIV